MYIQKNTPYSTYENNKGCKRHANRRRRRRRRMRRLRNCLLCVSIFTLTLAAASELHLLKLQSDSKAHYIAGTSAPQSKKQIATHASANNKTDTTGERLADTTIDDETAIHIASVSDKWNLILVNPWNPVPDDYQVDLVSIQSGHYVDARCYPNLQAMLTDCYNAGLSPLICSSYRTQEMQQELFDERIDELLAQGYSMEDAYDKAATSVARPGTSEHQIGLAVDIVDKNHQMLDSSQEQTPVQQWLIENSWKYGFILRYPNGTSELTGIIYEPWHYRYVGKKTAKKIHKQGVCLEEYLAGLLN